MKAAVFCSLLFLLISACDFGLFEQTTDKTELDKLPAKTTTGKYTVGYLYNCVAAFSRDSLHIGASYVSGFEFLRFSGLSTEQNIQLLFKISEPIQKGFRYDLTNDQSRRAEFVDFNHPECLYDGPNTFYGFIEFSRFDRKARIAAGEFEFSTVTDDCDTVHITHGRFDFYYTP